ncbi:IS5 family transposase [Nocardia sp. CA-084685]|uniref:IS5 family transposase n=1 Tax=Nocardia sp. CA-084685 TaxID=3239970 RepID=UPI003D968A68
MKAADRRSVARPAERYRPWKTAHERLRTWTPDGTWQRILDEVIVKDDSIGEIEWILSVDSTVVRAHPHAAGARKKGGTNRATSADITPDRDALGRSRGGLSTKIHLAVHGRGLPMRVLLIAGQAGDNPQILPLLDGISVARTGPGRPRVRPEVVIADKRTRIPRHDRRYGGAGSGSSAPNATTRSHVAQPRAGQNLN